MKLSLTYDRAGRSEGIAYVTYESPEDASKAIREFDGANAKGMEVSDMARTRLTYTGQPIRLISIPSGPSAGRRNLGPAPASRGSLFDRITLPAGRSRSRCPRTGARTPRTIPPDRRRR